MDDAGVSSRYNMPKRSEAARRRWGRRPEVDGPLDQSQSSPLSLETVCDRHMALLQSGDQERTSDALESLSAILRWRKRHDDPRSWEGHRTTIRSHALMGLMLQDPLCRAALASHRGLTSDPDILDLIYGGGTSSRVISAASPIGRSIYLHHHAAQHSQALRHLRGQMAEAILVTLKEHRPARIAVIDCGRLRELNQMAWSFLLPVDRFLAVDEDGSITSWVRRQGFHPRLRMHKASPSEIARTGLIEDGIAGDGFHLIYSLGALDRLGDTEAAALLRRLTASLATGGRLWLSNTLPDTPESAYRETFMNQQAYARSSAELKRLALALPLQARFRIDVAEDNLGEFGTLSMRAI